MTPITGNTYPVKDQIKMLGGRWNADAKAWMVPDDRAEEARQIVASATGKSFACDSGRTYRPNKCKVCGHVARRNSRGYPIGDRILRSGECQSCFEERKMGY